MPRTMKQATVRTHEKAVHTDLHGIRAGSHTLRMGVNPPAPDESVSRWAVREAQRVTGLSNKAMAINAGVAQSALSDALNGKGRNLDTDWIIAQGDQFVLAYNRAIERRLGLSPRAAHEQDAERIGELVTLLLKARRPEVA